MSVNVLDGNGNLKKIAHGFPESKFNILRADIIENIESTDTASKNYAVGDYLIMANGQLVKVINAISEDSVITSNDVQAITVEEMIAAKADSADIPDVSKYQKIFTGTIAEWNQLTVDQKTAYDLANITDDLGTEADIVDAVTDGDMRAVTSNAVHDALESKISTSETTGLVKNDGSIDTKSYAEKVANATENNLASLDENGNLKDGGWSSLKTTTSISGNPISISGLKSNQLAVNPIITLEPIQAGSGTPSPVNQRPISGYDKVEVLSCGKNLFDGTYSATGYYLKNDGTEYTASTTWDISQYISVKASTAYYFTNLSSASSACICWYTKAKEFISATAISGEGFTDTSPANACYVRCSIRKSQIDICINEGNTAITYDPYVKATSISESLGQTVYDGSLDVRMGKFTVKYGIVDLGDLSWQSRHTAYANVFSTESLTDYKFANDVNAICSGFNYDGTVSGIGSFALKDDGTICLYYSTGSSRVLYVKDSRYSTDANAFTTAVTGIKLVYELATPFTIQLTPHEISLLKDYAYVSTNGTNIALDYHNGEMASLGDISQVGETVNELLLGINDKGEFQLNSDWTGTADVYRLGKMVMLNINIHKADGTNFSANTNYEIGKLPIDYTTRKTQFGAGIELTSNVIDVCRVMVRNSNNRNVLVSTSSAGTYIQCTMVYWIIQ